MLIPKLSSPREQDHFLRQLQPFELLTYAKPLAVEQNMHVYTVGVHMFNAACHIIVPYLLNLFCPQVAGASVFQQSKLPQTQVTEFSEGI